MKKIELKEQIEYLESLLEQFEKIKSHCWLCGNKKDLTKHHIQPKTKRGNSDGLGYIILCRSCHEIVENIKIAISVCKKEKKLTIYQFKRILELLNKCNL